MKAHDVFPAVCYPDLFWKMAGENLDQDWYLMCPHEIMTVKGYCLEDSFGEEWERRYWDCVHDARIKKRTVLLKDLIRLIIKSAAETGRLPSDKDAKLQTTNSPAFVVLTTTVSLSSVCIFVSTVEIADIFCAISVQRLEQ